MNLKIPWVTMQRQSFQAGPWGMHSHVCTHTYIYIYIHYMCTPYACMYSSLLAREEVVSVDTVCILYYLKSICIYI